MPSGCVVEVVDLPPRKGSDSEPQRPRDSARASPRGFDGHHETVLNYLDGHIYTYDLATDAWSVRALPAEVLGSVGYPAFHAFYDPALNVAFVFVAGDSADNGVMWVYRYKRAR